MKSLMDQWDYNLFTNDNAAIKGFFQSEPTNTRILNVVGQAYFDKDESLLRSHNLRGLWSGLLKHNEKYGVYELTFVMKDNPIFSNTPTEAPYK